MRYPASALVVGIIASTKADKTPFSVEGSEVMRAIADANSATAMEKVEEQNKIAKDMQHLEN
jgi:hypothetical protein